MTVGIQDGRATCKVSGHFVTELNKLSAFYLTTAHHSVCSKGPKIHFHMRTFMWALVAALFTVALCQILGVNQGALWEDYRWIHYGASRQQNITMYWEERSHRAMQRYGRDFKHSRSTWQAERAKCCMSLTICFSGKHRTTETGKRSEFEKEEGWVSGAHGDYQGSEAILCGSTILAMGHETFVNTLVLMCQCRSIHCSNSATTVSDGPVGHVVSV